MSMCTGGGERVWVARERKVGESRDKGKLIAYARKRIDEHMNERKKKIEYVSK